MTRYLFPCSRKSATDALRRSVSSLPTSDPFSSKMATRPCWIVRVLIDMHLRQPGSLRTPLALHALARRRCVPPHTFERGFLVADDYEGKRSARGDGLLKSSESSRSCPIGLYCRREAESPKP